MVNEHYVQESYLRLFAPEDEGYIARYSLVDKHEGGDYRPARDRYPVSKAASAEGFVDGLLEGGETIDAERVMIQALRKLRDHETLSRNDIAHVSQFVAFQMIRTPMSKYYFDAKQQLSGSPGEGASWVSALEKLPYKNFQHFGWQLLENTTGIPFITSDDPVVSYFEDELEQVESNQSMFEGRQIFCPVGPDQLLLLLDPSRFDVDGQYPSTQITRRTISDRKEVCKMNSLQPVHAFQEVFGPADTSQLLENLVQCLCEEFGDEDYIRGNRDDLGTIERAQEIAAGKPVSKADREWYREVGKPITRSRRKKMNAIWCFNHRISLIESLQRTDPLADYWSG